jgi:hypothetical protein
MKIHKKEQLIRPVVNWRNAPAYLLSKIFTETINHLSPLPHAFNIQNNQELIRDLNDTPLQPHHTLASLDIMNLYSNIPGAQAMAVLTNMLIHELADPQTQEILRWYDVITKQNYLSHKNVIIQQDGLAMGAPSSSHTECRPSQMICGPLVYVIA